MMPKIVTYRSRPKKKCKSSSSLFDGIICDEIFDGRINSKSKNFDDVTNKKKKRVESFSRSLIFRRNSAQINRSEGNLSNQSYQFAPMATQTQLMWVKTDSVQSRCRAAVRSILD